eukprot:2097390-Rhodomonas_salina.1
MGWVRPSLSEHRLRLRLRLRQAPQLCRAWAQADGGRHSPSPKAALSCSAQAHPACRWPLDLRTRTVTRRRVSLTPKLP